MSRTDSTRSTSRTTVSCRTRRTPTFRRSDRSDWAAGFSSFSTVAPSMLSGFSDPDVDILDGIRSRAKRSGQQAPLTSLPAGQDSVLGLAVCAGSPELLRGRDGKRRTQPAGHVTGLTLL